MKCAIGQDSHRFESKDSKKPLILGGVLFDQEVGLKGNSDADVVLHAITNAISGITCQNILGEIADQMCQNGITDSREYVKKALQYLETKIVHISISIEAKKPKITPKIPAIRSNLSQLLQIEEKEIGITATTGEELTSFGRGEGIQVFVCLTVE